MHGQVDGGDGALFLRVHGRVLRAAHECHHRAVRAYRPETASLSLGSEEAFLGLLSSHHLRRLPAELRHPHAR